MPGTNDLTIIYYTANKISDFFMYNTCKQLIIAARGLPIIAVSQKPIKEITNNIVVGLRQSYLNIYRQALIGAKAANTTYIAMAEDDILYSPNHFNFHTPTRDTFAYNVNIQSIYTWVKPPIFAHKDRRNLHSLICERQLFIDAMEERFAKFSTDDEVPLRNWSEPGKYEDLLGVTIRKCEKVHSPIPNIAFSHKDGYQFKNLGTRKKLDKERCAELEYWGTAQHIMSLYENQQ